MRFTIDKEALLKGLTLVSKAIPPKAELPVLANVKLAMTEKGLEIIKQHSFFKGLDFNSLEKIIRRSI